MERPAFIFIKGFVTIMSNSVHMDDQVCLLCPLHSGRNTNFVLFFFFGTSNEKCSIISSSSSLVLYSSFSTAPTRFRCTGRQSYLQVRSLLYPKHPCPVFKYSWFLLIGILSEYFCYSVPTVSFFHNSRYDFK